MQPDRTPELTALLHDRILVLDGAMATMVQRERLSEEDFRGPPACGLTDHRHDVRGDNDLLALTQPHVIRAIHDAYLAAGADIIETNTFTATSIAQADYKLESRVREINLAAARLARECADRWSAKTPDKPRFVAGALGPTNRTASISPDVNDPGARNVTFDALADHRIGHDHRRIGAHAFRPDDRGILELGAPRATARRGPQLRARRRAD